MYYNNVVANRFFNFINNGTHYNYSSNGVYPVFSFDFYEEKLILTRDYNSLLFKNSDNLTYLDKYS